MYKSIWKDELLRHPELFSTVILSVFQTRTEALDRENYLHVSLNVHKNPLYVNMSTAKGKFGLLTQGFNKTHTEETKKLISEKTKLAYKEGRLVSPFKTLDVRGENNPFFGKYHTEETKAKMRKPKSRVPKRQCSHCGKFYDYGNYSQHIKRLSKI